MVSSIFKLMLLASVPLLLGATSIPAPTTLRIVHFSMFTWSAFWIITPISPGRGLPEGFIVRPRKVTTSLGPAATTIIAWMLAWISSEQQSVAVPVVSFTIVSDFVIN